jgi:hypothetical protein
MTLRVLAIILGFILVGVLMWNYGRDIDLLIFWLIWIFILIFIVTVYYYTRYRKYHVELNKWKEDYLRQSYLLIFETSIPKGNDTAEKVINLSSLVFPELRPDYIHYSPYYSDHINNFFRKIMKREYKLKRNYQSKDYLFDLVFKTLRGYYIVKDFGDELVTTSHIQMMIRVISKAFRNKYQRTFVFRVACIAKHYDSQFMNRGSLEKVMIDVVTSNIKIDLFIEEKKGFSVIWIS